MLHLPGKTEKGVKVPGVVMCHGFTGSRIENHCLFVKTARKLCSGGFAVLRFDFRGSGESEGEFKDVTFYSEIEDAEKAVKFMLEQKEIDRNKIGLIGLSMGGAVASCTAYKFREIKSLVLWSAVARSQLLEDLLRIAVNNLHGPLHYPVDYNGWLISRKFIESTRKLNVPACLAKFKNSVLLIHGSNDTGVPLEHAETSYKMLKHEKKLVIIKNADHTYSRDKLEKEVMGLTSGWLKKTLK